MELRGKKGTQPRAIPRGRAFLTGTLKPGGSEKITSLSCESKVLFVKVLRRLSKIVRTVPTPQDFWRTLVEPHARAGTHGYLCFLREQSPMAVLIVSSTYALAETSQTLEWLTADGRNSTQLQAHPLQEDRVSDDFAPWLLCYIPVNYDKR